MYIFWGIRSKVKVTLITKGYSNIPKVGKSVWKIEEFSGCSLVFFNYSKMQKYNNTVLLAWMWKLKFESEINHLQPLS